MFGVIVKRDNNLDLLKDEAQVQLAKKEMAIPLTKFEITNDAHTSKQNVRAEVVARDKSRAASNNYPYERFAEPAEEQLLVREAE